MIDVLAKKHCTELRLMHALVNDADGEDYISPYVSSVAVH